jgi:hypothetical protein
MSGHISRDNIVVVETRRRWSDDERRQAVEETQHLSDGIKNYGYSFDSFYELLPVQNYATCIGVGGLLAS